ncbi:hypothetical protein D2Q93_07945 [Alicyclobacillaceae bacterium I2511]|nr:hypothetical protein D2Q93_07945 [Alicyclobacillaceae bacterium I2511]
MGGTDFYGSGIKRPPVAKSSNNEGGNENKGVKVAYCTFFHRVCPGFAEIRAWRTPIYAESGLKTPISDLGPLI